LVAVLSLLDRCQSINLCIYSFRCPLVFMFNFCIHNLVSVFVNCFVSCFLCFLFHVMFVNVYVFRYKTKHHNYVSLIYSKWFLIIFNILKKV
jgi:hypothetical protein